MAITVAEENSTYFSGLTAVRAPELDEGHMDFQRIFDRKTHRFPLDVFPQTNPPIR